MKRRRFMALAVSASAALATRARAQQRPLPLIGYLGNVPPKGWERYVEAFRKGLADNGFVDGKNVRIEFRWSDGDNSRLPALAAELIALRPDVLAIIGGPGAFAARALTTTIPIVALAGFDPVKSGLVASINRPGGNVTGVFSLNSEIASKRLGVLLEAVPSVKSIGVLLRSSSAVSKEEVDQLIAIGTKLGIGVHPLDADDVSNLPSLIGRAARDRIGGLIVSTDTLLFSMSEQIAKLALEHGMPAISSLRTFAELGGLLSYGTDFLAMYRQQASYVARIVKGESPKDLPVLLPTRFEMVVNRRTAKQLGIELSTSTLLSADEVIE